MAGSFRRHSRNPPTAVMQTDARPPQADSCPADVPVQQLDLFVDNVAEFALHDLRRALAKGALAQAAEHIDALREAGGRYRLERDGLIRLWQSLSDAVNWAAASAQAQARVEALAALLAIFNQHGAIAHAADAALGELASDFLDRWRATLAAGLQGFTDAELAPERAAQATQALACLYRWRGDHPALRRLVEMHTDWRNDRQQLLLHASACEGLKDHRAALADWFELCRRNDSDADAESELDAALTRSGLLGQAWLDYADIEPPLPLALFPAWSSLCGYARFEAPPADADLATTALRAALDLLTDPASIDQRKRLRDIAPQLLPWMLGRRMG